MIDIENMPDDEFDALTSQAAELFTTIAQECLSQNDDQVYARLFKLYNDEDYALSIGLRNVDDEDEYDPEIGSADELVCAVVMLMAADGSLKNDVHAADIIFNVVNKESQAISANWFPDTL